MWQFAWSLRYTLRRQLWVLMFYVQNNNQIRKYHVNFALEAFISGVNSIL